MATKPHKPLDSQMLSMGVAKGNAAPASILPARGAGEPREAASRFVREPSKPRGAITIRVELGDLARLDNLARRTGIKKQELLDGAIRQMLAEADRDGNLTAPLHASVF